MRNTAVSENKILFNRFGELVRITPCGRNAIRFEGFPDCRENDENFTLIPQKASCKITENDRNIIMQVGELSVKLEQNGKLTFYKNDKVILEEKPELTFEDGYRNYLNVASGLWSARITFKANKGEHLYGLGHEATDLFDLKGCSFDMRNVNAKCTIPYIYSSLGYGFIWNNPAVGNVELSQNRTRWSVGATKKIDFVVIAGNPKSVTETLADLTGHAPVMPHWATGFWQSRLRYETQEDLLEVARRYKAEGIPLSAIVCDYFHWTEQGDYKFDPEYWQDIKAMTDELHDMGTRLVVSMWPTINDNSENYGYMRDNNMLMHTSRGPDRVFNFYGWQNEIDVTNPSARAYIWKKLKENYIDNGVDALWFDEAEPEIHPEQFDNLIWHLGRADEIAMLYPYYYSKLAYDGFKEMGVTPVTLTRCAYLGSQKFGSLVWSGDIPSTFESLSCQVKEGLNMSMCGIPWWNTDIGGFYGGDITSDDYKELLVRWFQYGVFSPVMRIHGNRNRHGERKRDVKEASGDPNEIWSYGEENFEILKELVFLRERLRPYIEKHMEIASSKGYPVMRPMFFDYPKDDICYEAGEQYMFGDDIIFAPIVNKGQTEKTVYLPEGEWILTKDKTVYSSGYHTITAQINEYIAFVKKGAEVISCF